LPPARTAEGLRLSLEFAHDTIGEFKIHPESWRIISFATVIPQQITPLTPPPDTADSFRNMFVVAISTDTNLAIDAKLAL
jgi:hypothetical protein